MKRTLLALLTLSAGALLVPTLEAQSKDRETARQKLIEKFDQNGDGKLDLDERKKARGAIAKNRQEARKNRSSEKDAAGRPDKLAKKADKGKRGDPDRQRKKAMRAKRNRPAAQSGTDRLKRRGPEGRRRNAEARERLGNRGPASGRMTGGRFAARADRFRGMRGQRGTGPIGTRDSRPQRRAEGRRQFQGGNQQVAPGQRRGPRFGAGQGRQGNCGCTCWRNNSV